VQGETASRVLLVCLPVGLVHLAPPPPRLVYRRFEYRRPDSLVGCSGTGSGCRSAVSRLPTWLLGYRQRVPARR
jgi:hypothetical protein